MIAQKFLELAQQHGTTYAVKEFKVGGTIGSSIPISIYTLHIVYKEVPVDIRFEFGNHNLAEFCFEIKVPQAVLPFKAVAREAFLRLIGFKSIWKITAGEKQFVHELTQMLEQSGMSGFVKETGFEPHIAAQKTRDTLAVTIKYYLGFPKKEDSLLIVANFCEQLISYFKSMPGIAL